MTEKLNFFPLDANYKIVDGRAAIYLYAKAQDGRQVCILDDGFQPYFYAIPRNAREARERLEGLRIERDNEVYQVAKVEQLPKRFLGREVNAFKVYTNLPVAVPPIAESIKEWDSIEGIYEYDILFARRYLIDKGIIPLVLHQATGEFVSQKSKIPVFRAENIQQLSAETLTNPRILAFDIETYSHIDLAIDAEKNPVIMLSFYAEDYRKIFVWKRFQTSNRDIEFVNSESELLEKFRDTIEEYKPDILTGYFSDGFDLPYLKTRAEKNRIRLSIGLDFSEMKLKSGRDTSVAINGITHLDIFKFIKRVMGTTMDTYTYDLNAVASELLDEKKLEVSLEELPRAWDSNQGLEKYCLYNLHDSLLTYNLAVKMLPTLIEMVKIVGLPVNDIHRMGFSQLVEWYLLRQSLQFNEIAPNKPDYKEIQKRRESTYQGAFVFEPRPGLYNDIVVFDFRSLYPTILSSHNVAPDTMNCACCQGIATPVPFGEGKKFWFCTKRRGFIPLLLEDLISRRMRIKEIIKNESHEKFAFLDARQNSLKLLANSFYGYLGFFAARWYSLECARSITAWGRFYIHRVIERAQKENFMVLYSDTDSVFLTLEGKPKEAALEFAMSINSELPGIMELDYEGFYPSGIFVSARLSPYGAKKKYAMISESGTLKIRGFETVRRNWSLIAKDVQENVLDMVLREGDTKKAFDYVRQIIMDLRKRKVPIEKVIIHTQLQKEIIDYSSKGPHVAVAQRLKNRGVKVGPGSMIKYVVTQGSDIIRNRSKLPEEVTIGDYDDGYYINNQVIPAVERIFNVLGYKKDDLLATKEQTKLGGFFN